MSRVFRVLKVCKKPSSREYRLMLRVTGIGLLAIGMYSFIVRLIASIIKLPYSPFRTGVTTTAFAITAIVIAAIVTVVLIMFLRRRR